MSGAKRIPLPPFVDRYEFDERAGILQFDGGLSREEAEREALAFFWNALGDGRVAADTPAMRNERDIKPLTLFS